MAKLLVLGGEEESAVLYLMNLDLRHSIFIDIVIGFQ